MGINGHETCLIENCNRELYAKSQCSYHYKQQWAIQNIESIKQKVRTWHQENKEYVRADRAKYYKDNKDKIKAYTHDRYISNKEKILKSTRVYYLNNKEKMDEKRRVRQRTLKYRFNLYQKSAKDRNLIFDLSIEEFEFITSMLCTYCDELNENQNYVGIDRVNNSLGYIKDNVVPCCSVCNIMKMKLPLNIFIKKIKTISEYLNKKLITDE